MRGTRSGDDELERDVAEVHPRPPGALPHGAAADGPGPRPPAAPSGEAKAEAGPGLSTGMTEEVELHEVLDLTIPVDGAELPARLYRPTADAVLPGHVHSPRRRLGAQVRWPAPTAPCACWRPAWAWRSCRWATAWPLSTLAGAARGLLSPPPAGCIETPAELGIDGADLSVGGDSAGGKPRRAAVALMARDQGGPSSWPSG